MTAHSALADSELHELKGAAGASSGQVPVADGAGSHTWTTVPATSISGVNNKNLIYIRGRIDDISTATSVYVPCPLAGTITSFVSVLQSAITTDDGDVRLRIGGTPVTDSSITITASSSAAGDVDTAAPTGANTVTTNSTIEIQTLGNASSAAGIEVIIAVDVS